MKKFFITVERRRNTTRLGQAVAAEVFKRYHHTVVSMAQLDNILIEIENIQDKKIAGNRRLKKMILDFFETSVVNPDKNSKWEPQTIHISLRTQRAVCGNPDAFILTANPIFKDYTIQQKGGGK